jgi:hypothetical protein
MQGSVSITFTSIVSRSGDKAEQKRAQALQKTQAQYSSRIRPYDKEQKNSVCPGMVLDESGVICLLSDLALFGNLAKSWQFRHRMEASKRLGIPLSLTHQR